MNPVFKIINLILRQINKLIGSIDQKIVETIRNAFYLLVAVLAVVAIFIGYTYGKHAAHRSGEPLADSTNKLFEITINKEKDKGQYKSLLETDFAEEFKNKDLNKINFPDNVKTKSEFDNTLIENNNTEKMESLQPEKNELAEINTDFDTEPVNKNKKNGTGKTEKLFQNSLEKKQMPNEKIKPIHKGSDLID